MKTLWLALSSALSELASIDTFELNQGASDSELQKLEAHLGVRLPDDLKSFLSVHNGQSDDGVSVVFCNQLLSTNGIREQWDIWRSIDEKDMNESLGAFMESIPEGHVRPHYSNKSWIPITHDGCGNHYGIDYDPDTKGSVGQIITFGRDVEVKKVIAKDFSDFISLLTRALSEAEWSGEHIEGEIPQIL